MRARVTVRARTAARFSAALLAMLCFSTLHAAGQERPLSLLKSANYSALDRFLTDRQRGYEAGEVPEETLYQGFRALYEDGVDNARYFDGWVRAYPQSYAARVARGAYYYRMAEFVRGDEFPSRLPADRLRVMDSYLALARPDLLASLKLATKPYLSALYLLDVARLDGSLEDRRKWLDAGNAIDPNNARLRLQYFYCLMPEWGGSIAMMRSFRAESERQHVSAALLTTFDLLTHCEIASRAQQEGRSAQAFSHWGQLLTLLAAAGVSPSDDALAGYARSAWDLRRRADADRALAQLAQRRVDDSWALWQMSWIYAQEKRYAEGWTVMQRAASLNYPWAVFSVGKTIYTGCSDIDLPANRGAGLVLIRRSANQGDSAAKVFLRADAFRNAFVPASIALCLMGLFLLRAISRHLQQYSENMRQAVNEPLLFTGMSARRANALLDFIVKRRYARLGDRKLTIRGDALRALICTFLGGFLVLVWAGFVLH